MSQDKESGMAEEDILRILRDSGYPLEQEIASSLEKMKWNFTLNYAFMDIETNVSREIDLLAERNVSLENLMKALNKEVNKEHKGQGWKTIGERVRLSVELLVECKKIKSPIVFFCRPKQTSDFFPHQADDIVQYSGVKPEIVVKPLNQRSRHIFTVGQLLRFGDLSHYSRNGEKATQFCKIYKSGKSLKADHAEVYQSFIVPLIKAVAHQKIARQVKPSWVFFDMFLQYPVIVIDGEILKADPECKTVEKTNHVELVRNYYSSKIGGTYRIDVVSKSYFCEFIEKVLMPSVLLIDRELAQKVTAVAEGTMRVRSMAKFFEFMNSEKGTSTRQDSAQLTR